MTKPTHVEIAHALNVLHGLRGFGDPWVSQPVTYASGERGTCLYVERERTCIEPYCMVKPRDGGNVQLWWLSLTGSATRATTVSTTRELNR